MAFPVDVDATWMNAPDEFSEPVYDAGDLRRADAAAFGGAGSLPLGVSGGIAAHTADSLSVAVDGSDVVTVQPGAVVIPGDAVTGTGCYRSALGSAATGNLTARHATLSRVDLVVFRALDVDVVAGHGAGNRKGRIEIIAGTPSGSPAVPSKPSMAVELGRISVPATGGGTATVDSSKRTFAVALGGELLVTTVTQLPAAAAPFQRARTLDTGLTYTWTGSAWDTGAWTPFTPAWTAVTTNPNIGNGTRTGAYRREGKTVHFWIEFTMGSTTTFGSGTWMIGLPPVAEVARELSFHGVAEDVSLSDDHPIAFLRKTSGVVNGRCWASSAGGPYRGLDAAKPHSWASGDKLFFSGTYEAA